MPQGFYRELRKILEENGCYWVRAGKGDHEIWFSPISMMTFPVDGVCRSRHTANGVLKQAGINRKL
jgi:hypothetical protein